MTYTEIFVREGRMDAASPLSERSIVQKVS